MIQSTSGRCVPSDRPQPPLHRLLELYEFRNTVEGRSRKTIEWYSANLRRFVDYLSSRDLSCNVEDFTPNSLRDYVFHLQRSHKYHDHPFVPEQAQQLAPASVQGHVRTLRAFLSWLHSEGYLGADLSQILKVPKSPRKLITPLDRQEVTRILGAFNPRSQTGVRDHTIFLLLLDTGLRCSELVSLEAPDVKLAGGYLKVMGKGWKERIVPFGSNVQRALYAYSMHHRPEPMHQGVQQVFLTASGQALTANALKLICARAAKRSGVHRLHLHLCRHTFATQFIANGGDAFSLQQILGHSTLEMTRRYVSLAGDQLLMQHRRFSPVDTMGLGRKAALGINDRTRRRLPARYDDAFAPPSSAVQRDW